MENNNLVPGQVVSCSQGIVSFEQFCSIVESTLVKYKFAKTNFLKNVLRCKEEIIKNAIESLIINYIKENPGMSGKAVCENLYVSIDYLNEMIDNGTLLLKPLSPQEIMEMTKLEQDNAEINKITAKRETLQKLSGAFNNQPTVEPEKPTVGFHFINNGRK